MNNDPNQKTAQEEIAFAKNKTFSAKAFEAKAMDRKTNRFYNSSATNVPAMPTPADSAVWHHKWMRVTTGSDYDAGNVAKHLQGGDQQIRYEICRPEDYPDFAKLALHTRHKELNVPVIQLTDSVLVRCPTEDFYAYSAAKRLESKDALQSRRKEAGEKYKTGKYAKYGNVDVVSDEYIPGGLEQAGGRDNVDF